MEAYEPPADASNAPTDQEAFALGSQHALADDAPQRPPWLQTPPPPKRPFAWPSGGKSPSWFRRMAVCPLQHAERYRRKRPDPTGLSGVVGNVIHGAIEDAANVRAFPGRRGPIPSRASSDELLYLLERQAEAVRQDLAVVSGDQAQTIVTTEVLARAREIVAALDSIDLSNLWIDPRTGKAGAEYIWSFYVHSQLLAAGIADLVQVQPNPVRPDGPPLEVTITDWKTGATQLPSEEELALDAQAGFELCWARRAFPRTPRIRFRLYNLTLQQQVWVDWTPGIDELMTSFARACWHIWQTKDETAATGAHCANCAYRSGCQAYQARLRDEVYSSPDTSSLEGKSMSELIRVYSQAKTLEDMASRRRKDAAKLILAGMGPRQKTYRAGNLVARKKSRRLPQYRDRADLLVELAEKTGTVLESIINTTCRFKQHGLENWIKTLPVAKQQIAREVIDQHQSLNTTPYWIEVTEKESVI